MSRCDRHVPFASRCELPEGHHGPCTSGRAQAYVDGPRCGADMRRVIHGAVPRCLHCDRIDAAEVLRLGAGGELRPDQVIPPWLKAGGRVRRNMVAWARSVLERAAAS